MSTSLLHLHVSRGKRSIVLDLTTDGGRATFLDLVASAGAVVEAMRPGMPWLGRDAGRGPVAVPRPGRWRAPGALGATPSPPLPP